jgi:oligopeptide/dipeptide ABC transporter ATP-binding protein
MALLEIKDLRTTFSTDDGPVCAVDGVSFEVEKGKVLGIVGESGCGKSVTMLSIMRLLSSRHSTSSGQAMFDGRDLLSMTQREMGSVRGSQMAMIFQDPMTSLNPVYKIGWQLAEAIRIHDPKVSKAEARERSGDFMQSVGIPSPRERLDAYPHELSGGMRQRVMIAMALLNDPKLLIADEPTTALDVTTQAQILQLIRKLRAEHDSAIIFITHDLGVVAELCDEVVVMYAGKIVERATVDELFNNPQHPYTWGLLGSLPARHLTADRLYSIPGAPPSLLHPPSGCRFRKRCEFAMDICADDPHPPLTKGGFDPHAHACLLPLETRQQQAKRFAKVEA